MMGFVRQLAVSEEGLLYQNLNVTLKIDHTQLQSGALYLSESALSWKPHGSEDGIAVPWKMVTVHAITTEPQKCVYMMLDFDLVWPGVHERVGLNGNGMDEDDDGAVSDEDNDEPAITEMWLLPSDDNEVDKMYQAMTDCQVLNPDETDDGSDDDDEGLGFGGGGLSGDIDEEDDDAEEQMQNLSLNGDDNRFADAD